MERFKQILLKILFPGLAVVAISVPVAAALLTYIFAFGHEYSPVAYVSYAFSAYSFTILCASVVKKSRGAKQDIQQVIHNNKLAHRYLTDIPFKVQVSLYLSLGINIFYAGLKLFYSVYYCSVWFATLGVYYFMLAVMRFLLLRHSNRNAFGEDLVSELKQYRMCGVILMMMNIALSGVVVLVVSDNEGFAYAGYLVYVMAMYAFYNMITAVRDVVKYRKFNSPVMSAAKAVKLAAALVSMLSLETAMLAQFNEREDPVFRKLMSGITGGCVCMVVLGIAVFMIVKSTRQLKTMQGS